MKLGSKKLSEVFKINLKALSKKSIAIRNNSIKKKREVYISNYLKSIKLMEYRHFKNLEKSNNFFVKFKKVNKKDVDSFFKKYVFNSIDYSKRKDRGHINSSVFKIKVYAITPSVLGSVRFIDSYKDLKRYIKIKFNFYKKLENHKFKYLEILPIDILGIKQVKEDKFAMVERVIPTESIGDIYEFQENNFNKSELISKYSPSFFRTLKKLGITDDFKSNENITKFNEFYKKLHRAYVEYYTYFMKNHIDYFDIHQGNLLFVDYNPKLDKFLLAPIDFHGVYTRSI